MALAVETSEFASRQTEAIMSSKGTYVQGTDGSDYIHRQRIVDRYSIIATARRRTRVLLVVNALAYAAFGALTFVAKFSTSSRSFAGVLDQKIAPIVGLGVIGVALSMAAYSNTHGARASWGAVKRCALAQATISAAQALSSTYARIINHREDRSAAWVWAEAVSAFYGKVFKWKVEAGAVYAMCVNAEVLFELMLVALPLGVYGMCLGIESHALKKNA